ncbi:MAG: ATP-binding protein, partial [Candidatus Methylomirabilis sp.]
MRARVKRARALQHERFSRTRTFCNAQMGTRQIRRH